MKTVAGKTFEICVSFRLRSVHPLPVNFGIINDLENWSKNNPSCTNNKAISWNQCASAFVWETTELLKQYSVLESKHFFCC